MYQPIVRNRMFSATLNRDNSWVTAYPCLTWTKMLADSHHPVFKKLVSCLAVYSLHKHSAAILASILKQLEYLFKIKINN